MSEAGHDHSQGHSHTGRTLTLAFGLTLAVLVVELVGAIAFNSLALAADAAHMFSDCLALLVAVIAQRMAARPATDTHSYGWRRAEVLAAQTNALLLLIAAIVVVGEAFRRFGSPSSVDAGGLIAVAVVGLVLNLVNVLLLNRERSSNMNVRAVALHAAGDALGSFAAIVAGVVIALGASDKADAVASLVIAVLVIWAGLRLLRDTIHVLLEATPAHLNADDMRQALLSDSSVETVHDLHVWTLAPGTVALSAHVELKGEITLHQAQQESIRLKALLSDQFSVDHSTLELECHPCADEQLSH